MAEQMVKANLKWTYIKRNRDGSRSKYGPGEVDIPVSLARTLGITVPQEEAAAKKAAPKRKSDKSKTADKGK